MNYKLQERKNNTIKIDFEINAKEWETEVEKAYQKNKGKYKKEGFRQGKVPRKVLENTYGEYLFFEDAFNDGFGGWFATMLKKEKNLQPVADPDVSINEIDKNGVKFTAEITLYPEFELKKYTGFTIEKNSIEVSKAEITREMEQLREKNARYVEVKDRAVQNGDLVNLDFEGSVDGKLFDGGAAKDFELTIGSKQFIEGFEEQMIGMKTGEEKDLKVKFPATYHAKDLSGKDAVFAVKVLSIREKQLPNLDDEFVKDATEFSTLTELSLDIESKIAAEKEKNAEQQLEVDILTKISEGIKIDIPEKMVEREVDNMLSSLDKNIANYGLDRKTYFEISRTTEEQYRKDSQKAAATNIKNSLIIEKVVNSENFAVSAKEIKDKYEELAKTYSMTVEQIKTALSDENVLKSDIRFIKAIKFLKENNNIIEKDKAAKKETKPAKTEAPKKAKDATKK